MQNLNNYFFELQKFIKKSKSNKFKLYRVSDSYLYGNAYLFYTNKDLSSKDILNNKKLKKNLFKKYSEMLKTYYKGKPEDFKEYSFDQFENDLRTTLLTFELFKDPLPREEINSETLKILREQGFVKIRSLN
jgi:hypothetical protein